MRARMLSGPKPETCCGPVWRPRPGSRSMTPGLAIAAAMAPVLRSATQIGNDHFAAFATTASKSRLNFLALLRAGHGDYVINGEALTYMRDRALSGQVIERLATHPAHTFPDEAAWMGHLQRLGIPDLRVSPDPVRIATEGALWGAIKAHGFLPGTVIVSDDAGQ